MNFYMHIDKKKTFFFLATKGVSFHVKFHLYLTRMLCLMHIETPLVYIINVLQQQDHRPQMFTYAN